MATPEHLEALADRIDHEQLWRKAAMYRDDFTQDQLDRLDAGVQLRRYARDKRGNEIERLRDALVHIECEPINAEYLARAALDGPNAELRGATDD